MKVFAVTGDRGSGKTRFLEFLAEQAQTRAIPVAGFVQCRVYAQPGAVVAYDLCRISNSSRIRVATRGGSDRFEFEESAFRIAEEWIRMEIHHAGLIVIDELGTLELDQQAGHLTALNFILGAETPRVICCALRKNRASAWRRKLAVPFQDLLDLDDESADRAAFIERILAAAQRL